MQRKGKDIFIDHPKAHVAIRFVTGGYAEFDLSGLPEIREHGIYLKSDQLFSPMIIEVAAPGMFAPSRPSKKRCCQMMRRSKKAGWTTRPSTAKR
jgi:hypothetical protein